MNRRNLFASAIAALAALVAGKAKAKAEPEMVTHVIDVRQSWDPLQMARVSDQVARSALYGQYLTRLHDDGVLTALYHEHFGSPGKTVSMDEATAEAWDRLMERRPPQDVGDLDMLLRILDCEEPTAMYRDEIVITPASRQPGEPFGYLVRHYADGRTQTLRTI